MKLLPSKEKKLPASNVIQTNYSAQSTLGSISSASYDHNTDTPNTKLTTQHRRVVSVLVEIVACSNLSKHKHKERIDPYVKVKLSKPLKRGGNQLNLHKTKPIKNTTNPRFTRMSHSSFVMDGLSVPDLYKADGLQFKVKHSKHDLGYLHLTPQQLLHASGQDTVLQWIHPLTMLPGRAGTITLKINPLRPIHNKEGFKCKGMGYFVEYTEAPPQDLVAADTQESDSYMEDEELKELLSPRSKAKKGKSWKTSFFGSSSKDKRKLVHRERTETIREEPKPIIAASPHNDEEYTRMHQEQQSTNIAETSSELQGKAEEEQETTTYPIESTTQEATEVSSLDPYDAHHGRPDEVYLDFRNLRQETEVPCGMECCFSLFGWTPKKVVSNLMEYSDPDILSSS